MNILKMLEFGNIQLLLIQYNYTHVKSDHIEKLFSGFNSYRRSESSRILVLKVKHKMKCCELLL